MTSPENLYTTKDITRVREKLYKAQGGIDPILKEKIELTGSVLDHSHVTQNCRATLHRCVNVFEGLVVRAHIRYISWLTEKPLPEILRNLADYYEEDYSKNPVHPGWLKKSLTEFRKLPVSSQNKVLLLHTEPVSCKNKKEREAIFKKIQKKLSYEIIMDEIWRHQDV